MSARRVTLPCLLLGLLWVAPLRAQEDFKELIARGEYVALGELLRTHLDLAKADPKLRPYLEMNLEYLARNAEPRHPGSEIVLVRGARNDSAYEMPASSGGKALMLPNTIRYAREPWRKRLKRIKRYFRFATTDRGGNGEALHELERIIEHHKGGGLGTNANSTRSVLISTSTKPLHNFGPPYYILKIPPERAIFNTKGLTGEAEVLVPFWVLPKEIVTKVNSFQEVMEHPAYQASKFKDLQVRSSGYGAAGSSNNWEIIEDNIRNGRTPLEGVAGLNSFFPGEGTEVGPNSSERDVRRFVEKVERHGGSVEFVGPLDKRLPEGAQARTYLGSDGRPRVLLREGTVVKKFALLDELTHVLQLERMLKARGPVEVQEILWKARLGEPAAKDVINRWEIRAKKLIRGMLEAGDPARPALDRSIRALEAELDPYVGARRAGNGTVDWKAVGRQFGSGVAHFSLALFLKELALVARTGDRLLIEEFFDGLLTTDFYVHYGLFSLGAAAADTAYVAYLQKHAARFIRPRFVQSVLRSNVSLAVGMALPELLSGHFDGKAFAINLSGLALSSTAVKAGVAGLRWVLPLRRLPGGAGLAARLGTMHRLTRVGGWLFTAVETAVVLYFGDAIAREIDRTLELRTARAAIREASQRLLADPTGPEARANLDALAAAHRAYRDVLVHPLREAEAILYQRLNTLGVDVKRNDDALAAFRGFLERTPGSYENLGDAAARVAARREAAFNAETAEIIEAYQTRFDRAAAEVYGELDPQALEDLAEDPAMAWALRGAPAGALPDELTTSDWTSRLRRRSAARRLLEAVSEPPDTRLAAYDHEAAVYEALAGAHAHDPLAAAEFAERARRTRELRDRDRGFVLGEGPAVGSAAGSAEPRDATVNGFIEALHGLGE